MIQTRIIGKLLRGKATAFQIASACVLGALIGAQPGLGQAPGLLLTFAACLLVLNANLFFAGLVAGLTKIASLALIAVQFELGMLLIDGPLQPLARAAVNAPVLAWFGFDNYVAVGGLAFGGAIGAAAAVVVSRLIAGFRKKMADLEETSEQYKAWAGKGWVKALSWLLIGGNKGKKSYQELSDRKSPPIRIPGVIAALIMIGGVVAIPFVLTDGVVTSLAREQLGRANGATVDIESASVDLGGGKATLTGLQVADRADLDRNLVEAAVVNADFSTRDLLRKRVTIDEAVASDVKRDTARATRGELIGRAEPSPAPPPGDENEGPLEDYIEDAEQWKARLERLRDWLEERSSGEEDADDDGVPDADPDAPDDADPDATSPKRESLRDRLRRRARELGYASVTADHLIEDHPRVLVRSLRVEGVTSEADARVYDLTGSNVSTDPDVVEESAVVRLVSRDGSVNVEVALPGSAGGAPRLDAGLSGLSGDDLASRLRAGDTPPFSGGTVDLSLNAALPAGTINAPLIATLRGSTVNIPELGPQIVDELRLPIRLSGPIDNPSIRVDPGDLADALAAAGKSAAARRVREEAENLTDEALERAGDAVPDDVKDNAREGLRSLFGGGDKP